MTELLQSEFVRDFVGRFSMVLVVGLLLSFVWRKRPDRAHQLLFASLIAAILVPAFCGAVRWQGWGILPPVAERTPKPATVNDVPSDFVEGVDNQATALLTPVSTDVEAARPHYPSHADLRARNGASSPLANRSSSRFESESADAATTLSVHWPTLLASIWGFASVCLLARLLIRFMACRRLVCEAAECEADWVRRSIQIAEQRVGLQKTPRVCTSRHAKSPMIWCWSRPATLFLPEDAAEGQVDWVAVFAHELAHWKRRDYWSSLIADLMVAFVPWNPVVWWCRIRLNALSEQSCDDWAVYQGSCATDYAESLLNLIPQPRQSVALSVVGEGSVASRVQRLLKGERHRPGTGPRWRAAVAGFVLLTISAFAFAQTKTVLQGELDNANEGEIQPPTLEVAADEAAGPLRVIRGTVTKPDGNPASNVPVYWLGRPRERDRVASVMIAEGVTDGNGHFELQGVAPDTSASFEDGISFVIARAPEAGIGGVMVDGTEKPLSIKLPKNLPIEGRLLTPDGEPAEGVRVGVSLMAKMVQILPPKGWGAPSEYMKDGKIHTFAAFPKVTSDAEGRFRIDGLSRGAIASLRISSDDYAPEELHVSAPGGVASLMQRMAGPETKKPKFTHTLEPARVIKGRVVTNDSNKPLPDVEVKGFVVGNRNSIETNTRTDENGEYRMAVGEGQFYSVSVRPSAKSGYLCERIQRQKAEWPDATKPLDVNFSLEKGRPVTGRIVNGDGKPVVGARIEYHPHGSNPRASRGTMQQQPVVLSAKDGSFLVNCLPGRGFLVADGPSTDFARQPLRVEQHGGYEDWYVHGFASLDIGDDVPIKPVTISLKSGQKMRIKVVDEAGKPLKNVAVHYDGINSRLTHRFGGAGRLMRTADIELPGCDQSASYRVFFVHGGKKLGAVAELKYDGGKQHTVTLTRMASLKGRFVTEDGTPIANRQVITMAQTIDQPVAKGMVSFNQNRTVRMAELGGEIASSLYRIPRTDNDGKFSVVDVIPGAEVYVQSFDRQGITRSKTVRVATGETLDLGDITWESMQ